MAETIRTKGFEQKRTDPPPAAAAPPPKAPEKPPAIVFKMRPASPPPAEAAAPPRVEEAAVVETPVEVEAATVEPPEEIPAEPFAETPADVFEETTVEPTVEVPGGQPEQEVEVSADSEEVEAAAGLPPAVEEPVKPSPPEASRSGGIRSNFRQPTVPPKAEEVSVAPVLAQAPKPYDPDPGRVEKRRQWKWNLYVRSGRQKEDEAAQGKS